MCTERLSIGHDALPIPCDPSLRRTYRRPPLHTDADKTDYRELRIVSALCYTVLYSQAQRNHEPTEAELLSRHRALAQSFLRGELTPTSTPESSRIYACALS